MFFSLFFATLVSAASPEIHGYLRAGTGTNGKGGRQECYANQGAPGNEMRLGNECSIYGELALSYPFVDEGTNGPFWRATTRLAYFPPGDSSFEDNDRDNRDINIVEAFLEGGRLRGSPLTYWVGKRFYRDTDLYIHDWYYFAQMNGNGAGVGNIPLGSGQGAVAYLVETSSVRTDRGRATLQALDFRWQEIALGSQDHLHLWGAFGWAAGGTTAGKEYLSQRGWLAGLRWRHSLEGGFHDLTVVHGQNLLESLSLYGNSALEKAPGLPAPARRWRFVDHLAWDLSKDFGLFAGAALELWDPRTPGTDSRGSWWNVAARPTYFFSDHFQLAFEAGHSVVEVRNERNAGGGLVGPRHLTRLTLAPQLALARGLWARPALRLFYSRSFWNEANRAFVAQGAPSAAGAGSGQSIGVQAEVWF